MFHIFAYEMKYWHKPNAPTRELQEAIKWTYYDPMRFAVLCVSSSIIAFRWTFTSSLIYAKAACLRRMVGF